MIVTSPVVVTVAVDVTVGVVTPKQSQAVCTAVLPAACVAVQTLPTVRMSVRVARTIRLVYSVLVTVTTPVPVLLIGLAATVVVPGGAGEAVVSMRGKPTISVKGWVYVVVTVEVAGLIERKEVQN